MVTLKIYLASSNGLKLVDTIRRTGKSACTKVARAHYTSPSYTWKWV
jgi:hypothetical protein